MTSFSESLINAYKTEMASTYGVFVDDTEAQVQLRRLARSMFPIVIVEQETGSRETGQG